MRVNKLAFIFLYIFNWPICVILCDVQHLVCTVNGYRYTCSIWKSNDPTTSQHTFLYLLIASTWTDLSARQNDKLLWIALEVSGSKKTMVSVSPASPCPSHPHHHAPPPFWTAHAAAPVKAAHSLRFSFPSVLLIYMLQSRLEMEANIILSMRC